MLNFSKLFLALLIYFSFLPLYGMEPENYKANTGSYLSPFSWGWWFKTQPNFIQNPELVSLSCLVTKNSSDDKEPNFRLPFQEDNENIWEPTWQCFYEGEKVDIEKIKNLRFPLELNFRGSDLDDKGIKFILKMNTTMISLTDLDLQGVGFSDEGLGYLKCLSNLKTLVLSGSEHCQNGRISDAGLMHIAHLRNLTSLDLHPYSSEDYDGITDQGFSCFIHLTGLTELDISSLENISDISMLILRKLPLKRLNISHCIKITDKGLNQVAQIETLRELDMCELNVSGLGFFRHNLKNLTALDYDGCHLSPLSLPVINELKLIIRINLGKNSRL